MSLELWPQWVVGVMLALAFFINLCSEGKVEKAMGTLVLALLLGMGGFWS